MVRRKPAGRRFIAANGSRRIHSGHRPRTRSAYSCIKLTAVSKKHAWIVPDPNESANEARPRLGKAPRRDIRHRLKIAGTEGEIDSAFAALPRLQAGALIVTTSELFSRRRERLVTLAAHHAVPEVYPWREAATAGP